MEKCRNQLLKSITLYLIFLHFSVHVSQAALKHAARLQEDIRGPAGENAGTNLAQHGKRLIDQTLQVCKGFLLQQAYFSLIPNQTKKARDPIYTIRKFGQKKKKLSSSKVVLCHCISDGSASSASHLFFAAYNFSRSTRVSATHQVFS